MLNVFITGATGNVGVEVIKSLLQLQMLVNITAGVKDVSFNSEKLKNDRIEAVKFDITDTSTFKNCLKNVDVVFLMRPPQISAVKKYFKPFIEIAIESKIKYIVFLSVQGVEKNSIIPHHKIERLIVESKIPYTFLRPAYFMQNFTTTLSLELRNNRRIYLPAGNAKFTLVDVRDIGNVAAVVISNKESHTNRAYDLTCNSKYSFYEMAEKLSEGLEVKITYESPSLFNFYLAKRKENTPFIFIMVMIMLHYFPRFQKEPAVTNCIEEITGHQPITFEDFVEDNKKLLM